VQKKIWALDESVNPPNKILLCTMPRGLGPSTGATIAGCRRSESIRTTNFTSGQLSSIGGSIFKLARSGPPPTTKPFPPRLSPTGAFSDLASLTPNRGLIPYNVNCPLWSDNAVKHRWMALPKSTKIGFASTGEWTFPDGAVFVKQFDLPTDETKPNKVRRLETRLLVRDTNGAVYGVAYKSRKDQTDAEFGDQCQCRKHFHSNAIRVPGPRPA
jgi:hypothetical protein